MIRHVSLTWWGIAGINVDVIETGLMTSWSFRRGTPSLTTTIARMLGKAVQLRHCPATVSAPAGRFVVRNMQESSRGVA
jgi:hypothetical protein